ncbi:MAG: hypothetical protein E7318_05370 [Clostridiales bacterium]|nr:hypothetical protein [Clostridiales bacterium]
MRNALTRQVKLVLAILVGYLAHVSVMPYIRLGDVSPSLLIAMTAIITVGYGMLRGLWTGMFYGIVMEIMLPTVPMLNLLFYPISALLCAVFFADRSEAQLQYARSIGKRGRNISPLVRTVLCAFFNCVIYDIVNLVYMYLSGAALSSALIQRGFSSVLATTLLTIIIMVPVRKILGFRKQEEKQAPQLRFDHRPERDTL